MDQEPSKLPKELYLSKKKAGWPRFAQFSQYFFNTSGGGLSDPPLISRASALGKNSKMDQEPSKLPKELYKMLLISQTRICPKQKSQEGGLDFAPFTQYVFIISGGDPPEPPFISRFSGASRPRYISLRSTYSIGSLHHPTLFFDSPYKQFAQA